MKNPKFGSMSTMKKVKVGNAGGEIKNMDLGIKGIELENSMIESELSGEDESIS